VDEYNNEMKERVAILNRLIGAGADINVLDIHLRTPLHYAVCYRCLELVTELLEYARTDGSLNVRDENGWTPLFTAVAGERTRESLALIQAGADVSIPTNDNKTPLQIPQL
jgi:ankyrin repeat protein